MTPIANFSKRINSRENWISTVILLTVAPEALNYKKEAIPFFTASSQLSEQFLKLMQQILTPSQSGVFFLPSLVRCKLHSDKEAVILSFLVTSQAPQNRLVSFVVLRFTARGHFSPHNLLNFIFCPSLLISSLCSKTQDSWNDTLRLLFCLLPSASVFSAKASSSRNQWLILAEDKVSFDEYRIP